MNFAVADGGQMFRTLGTVLPDEALSLNAGHGSPEKRRFKNQI